MSFAGLLNATATAYRNTFTQNAMGANVTARAAVVTAFKCRVRQLSASERAMSMSRGTELTHRLYKVPSAVEVAEGDEVEVGTTIYDVLSVYDAGGGQGHHMEIDLRERRPDRHGS
jgi:hypothetical protein